MLLLLSGQSSTYLALVQRTNFQGLYLATLSAGASSITVQQRAAPFGGVGNLNLKPPTSATPTLTLNSSSVTAEGGTAVTFAFSATIANMTFDDTIASVDVSYSIEGSDAWHPWVPCVFTPSSGSSLMVNGVVHGLAAGQSYDVALQPRGVNGQPLGSPLIIGNSPTVDSSTITVAILAYTAAVEATLGQTPDTFGKYTLPGVFHRLHFDNSGQPGGTNLIFNPTGAAGFNGWTRFNNGGNIMPFTFDTFGGGRWNTGSASLPAGDNDGWKQQITLPFNNQHMVLSGVVNGNTLPAGVSLYVDVLNAVQNATLAAFTMTTSGTTQPFAVAFNSGANTSCWVRWYLWNQGASAATCQGLVQKLQLEYGTQPSAYVDHDAAAGHNTLFTSRSTGSNGIPSLKASTPFVSTTPNTVAYVTDATIEFSWSGTGPYTVKAWFDNGTAATDSTVIWPDSSTSLNLGHTTSASPSFSASSIPSGTNYYAVLHVQNGVVTMTVQTTPFTTAAFAAYFADGGIVPAAAQAGTPLFTASGSGGSGGVGGGGGGHNLK